MACDCVLATMATTLAQTYNGSTRANVSHLPDKVGWSDLDAGVRTVVPAEHWHESQLLLVSCVRL